jgi:CRP/FNR family transcriptional regulator
MTVPKGATLFQPGQACAGFVVVHDGTIKVSLIAENGREIILYRVRPGDICLQTFGCLIEGRDYSAEGVAESALDIEIIPAAEFQRRIVEDAAFRAQLLAAVAHRFSDMERLVEDVALTGFEARLARVLIRLGGADGLVEATHEALATEMGSGRAAVSRGIGAFTRAGLIAHERGRIHLLDAEGLEALAHEPM